MREKSGLEQSMIPGVGEASRQLFSTRTAGRCLVNWTETQVRPVQMGATPEIRGHSLWTI